MGNAAPVSEATKFLENLKGSQLLPAEELGKLEGQFGNSPDPKAIARALIKANRLTNWQAAQLLRGFKQFQIGKYTLQDQLGANETGRVYLAEHGKLGKKVALKLLSKRLASDPKVVKRFLAEARIAAAIDHRNIMHVYDVDREGEQVFIVTEYVDGVTINKLIEKEKLPLNKALSIFTQLIEGMAVAHEKGVVHGGLRPSTTLIDALCNVKICDLGVASISDSTTPGQEEESAEMPIDAVQYSAPERANSPPTIAMDIYAIGGILYTLLTGEVPKSNWRQTDSVKSKQISIEVLTELRAKAATVPDAIRKLCALMLAPNPVERPKSCREISKGLPALMQSGNKAPAKEPTSSATPAGDAGTAETKAIPAIQKTAVAGPGGKPLPRAKALPTPATSPVPKTKAPTVQDVAKKERPRFELAATTEPEVVEGDAFLVEAEPEIIEPEIEAEVAASSDSGGGGFGGIAINTGSNGSTSSGGFAIKTSAPANGAVKKPAAAGAVTTTTTTVAAAGAPPKSNLPLILGLSIGGGVLALAGIVGVVWMFSGGEEKVVKNNKGGEKGEKDPGEKKPSKEPEDTENNPSESNPSESNPGESNPGEANPTPRTVNNNPPVVPPDPNPMPIPMPVDPAPIPVPVDPAPMPTPEPTPPLIPVPEPMPEPKPMPKPPATEPFKGMPPAVQLPALTAMGKPVPDALNEVKLGPAVIGNSDCYVDMYGGEFAFKGTQRFVLEPGNGGTSTSDWDIAIQFGENATNKTNIAKLAVKEDSLVFQWLPAAAENNTAPYLCNCVLNLRAGKGQQELRLRTPVAGNPMDASSSKPINAKWAVDFLPNPEKVKVEFLSAEGPIPNTKFTPKEFVHGGEQPMLWFGNVDTNMPLAIAFKPTFGARQFELVGTFNYKTEQEQKPVTYVKKKLEQGYQQAMGQVVGINQQAEAAKAGKNQPERTAIDAQAGEAIAKWNKIATGYEEAVKMHESLKGGVKVNFRVVYIADDGKEVEILTTKAG